MPAIRPRTKDHKVRRIICRTLAVMLLLAIGIVPMLWRSSVPPMVLAEEETPMPRRYGTTVMYVMDEPGLELRNEDADMLDQLNYSFALIKDGRADGSHWTSVRKVTAFLKKHPQIDGVLSVGGWGADGFSDACATVQGREALAKSILDLMDAHGFVGVDIDWEYPGVQTEIRSRPEDVENWYALLTLLREGLDAREASAGRDYILSVALGAGNNHVAAIDPARLDSVLDQAVVMAYDLCGFDRQTGHHAGLYPGKDRANTGAMAVKLLTEGGLSPEKILLGIPAYGRVWRQVSGGDGLSRRAGTSGNKTMPFDRVLQLEQEGYTRYYDEEAQAAWWFNGSSFVSAEDDRSVFTKCAWLRRQGLQGAAVWSSNQDASGAMLAMLNAAMCE